MTTAVQKLTADVQSLDPEELDEFYSWLADFTLGEEAEWDTELAHDAQPGGRLDAVLQRVRADIAAGKTKPLSEILDHP